MQQTSINANTQVSVDEALQRCSMCPNSMRYCLAVSCMILEFLQSICKAQFSKHSWHEISLLTLNLSKFYTLKFSNLHPEYEFKIRR